MARNEAADGIIVIKKYANRRLYDTDSSSYITLDHLAKMTRDGIDFQVVDAKSGTDITHQILTQIIMDEEASGGSQMLPVSFLRDLISMYGNSMQSMVPHYLEMSMQHFRENQMKMRKALEGSLGASPIAKLAQQNLAMFKAATAAFMPGSAPQDETGDDEGSGGTPSAVPVSGSTDAVQDDLDLLRKQMAEMQSRLDRLGK
ncbi:polyhydroxyalkanoate synthesis repressor PhaR [Croceicoccus sp. F390]|uniref:Polyhydroxyalkanoate synthesis repressor PhaR n=1 Tax=Croceicoccus esteveae TaxID=3075597 RepID=A0ABU2ZG02_9SPHN|nr:polyhydroxyalkanoate synthesis repressor PhaR [Croceicoccus sp. F390]MDT0575532.1 polyhydroxyalkanoate synthesis repressor PhaR [Croceicoccus sp. F390]